ncbi:MAG: ATP-binding protein [Rubrivivax sp.]
MGDAAAVRELLRAAFAADGAAGLRRLRRLSALLCAGRAGAVALHDARRLAHTLKGAGSLLGAAALERAAHAAEDALLPVVPGRPLAAGPTQVLGAALVRLQRAVQAQLLPGPVVVAPRVELGTLAPGLGHALQRWCRARGCRAQLVLRGARTPVEPALLGPLGDALSQLLRNAVEHGIEPPAQRIAAGKAAEGRILLSGRRVGAGLVLRVSDDGRGLDLERIARAARARGLLPAGRAIGARAAARLVLQPGFSTRRRAGLRAGRGEGLHLVQHLAQAAGGSLRLHSRGGRGLTAELHLTAG